MKRTASLPTRQVRYLAHKALKALGFVNLDLLFKAPPSPPSSPATLSPPAQLQAQDNTGLPGETDPAGQGSACRLQIPFEDWNILFQSVQSRLRKTVGEHLASSPSLQSDDAAADLQVVVLDCVAAMEQLRTALTPERA
ncbi:hypothetical protein [Polaromonas sp.]|uniref:hypothetical protein n=1 Tax=Polaromonas sp. TaxID=1869339 RepID=UPI0024882FB6|nr:hypothetical protein [Polaromonas sp.]MDI1342381.1 hypothetical protein [Polaromonas sp.]